MLTLNTYTLTIPWRNVWFFYISLLPVGFDFCIWAIFFRINSNFDKNWGRLLSNWAMKCVHSLFIDIYLEASNVQERIFQQNLFCSELRNKSYFGRKQIQSKIRVWIQWKLCSLTFFEWQNIYINHLMFGMELLCVINSNWRLIHIHVVALLLLLQIVLPKMHSEMYYSIL